MRSRAVAVGFARWRRGPRDLGRTPLVAVWEAAGVGGRPRPAELGTGEALALVDRLADLDPGVVVLAGHDPLERPDLVEIIEAMVGRGLAVALAPEVTPRLTATAIRRLARAGVGRIALGLDGPDAPAHDGVRGRPGSFAATRAAIDAVRAAGMSLQIDTSLTRPTAAALHATGRSIAALGPDLWNVVFVVPSRRVGPAEQMPAGVAEDVFHFLYDWREETGLAVETTAAPAFRRVQLVRQGARPRLGAMARWPRPLPVNDGKGMVFVSHTGTVYPSALLPLPVGNVREQPLADLYRGSRLLRTLRAGWRLRGRCGVCPYRAICGGSRARAWATTGDVLAEDPACAYVPPRRATAPEETWCGSYDDEAGAGG